MDTLKEVPESRYIEMLEILPPEVWLGKGFLVGEPFDHRRCSVTTLVCASFASFFTYQGKFYEGGHMTIPEFKAFNLLQHIPEPTLFEMESDNRLVSERNVANPLGASTRAVTEN